MVRHMSRCPAFYYQGSFASGLDRIWKNAGLGGFCDCCMHPFSRVAYIVVCAGALIGVAVSVGGVLRLAVLRPGKRMVAFGIAG